MAAGVSDTIRMTVPADPTLAPVVQVATGVLARRADLPDEQVAEARAAVAAAFTDLVGGDGASVVEIELRVGADALEVLLTCGPGERSVRAP